MVINKGKNRILFCLTVFLILLSNTSKAQEFNLINEKSSLTVLGTSSLHDWEIVAETYSGKIVFKDVKSKEIDTFYIEILTESLKSGKRGMDRNTYKALHTDTHKTIKFQLLEIQDIIAKGAKKSLIKMIGNLTISGVKKQIPLEFLLQMENNKIALIGEKKIKMTDFNIDPPKALLGTITTGDEVVIKFETQFK